MGLVAAEHVDLLVAVHGMPQAQARAQLQVTRLEHTFEQQDRAAPAQGPHPFGLGQVQQRKAVGPAQAVEHPLDAMAIGIGLNHSPDLGVLGRLAHPREVVAQGGRVDGGKNGARHKTVFPKCG